MHVGDILWITVHHWCWFVCCLGWYTDSIQFCLYVTIVLLWPELLQEDWQCAVCLELALININGDYYLAGCLLPVASSIGAHGNCNRPADTMGSRSQTCAVFCSKPFRVLELQHEPYLLVLIPWNVSCLEITLVSMQWSMVMNLHWDSGGDMPTILQSHNARVSHLC